MNHVNRKDVTTWRNPVKEEALFKPKTYFSSTYYL